jgi:hypothetical protein
VTEALFPQSIEGGLLQAYIQTWQKAQQAGQPVRVRLLRQSLGSHCEDEMVLIRFREVWKVLLLLSEVEVLWMKKFSFRVKIHQRIISNRKVH